MLLIGRQLYKLCMKDASKGRKVVLEFNSSNHLSSLKHVTFPLIQTPETEGIKNTDIRGRKSSDYIREREGVEGAQATIHPRTRQKKKEKESFSYPPQDLIQAISGPSGTSAVAFRSYRQIRRGEGRRIE